MHITSKVIRLTFLGGAFGTLLRYALWVLIGDLVSVILVNLIGSALIGYLNGLAIVNKKYDTDSFGAFWKIGFAGGFTTMSGFVPLLVVNTLTIGPLSIAVALVITALGFGAYWLAFRVSSARAKS